MSNNSISRTELTELVEAAIKIEEKEFIDFDDICEKHGKEIASLLLLTRYRILHGDWITAANVFCHTSAFDE